MRPSTKAVAYIKRMITSSKWTRTIPSAPKIAKTLSVSDATVRKALRILENKRMVENNGSLGYGVIPKKFEELYHVNRQLYFLAMLNRNLRIAKLIDLGAKIKGNFAIFTDGKDITVGDTITGDVIKTNMREVDALFAKRVTVDHLLSLNGAALRKAKETYLRQKRIAGIGEFLMLNRKEFEENAQS